LSGRTLALVMAGEQFVIALVYLHERDFRHACYWFFGGCIILSVTL